MGALVLALAQRGLTKRARLLARRLEPAQSQKGGEVTVVAAIGGGREIELRLPGRYTLDAALRGALKTAPGVALLEDV